MNKKALNVLLFAAVLLGVGWFVVSVLAPATGIPDGGPRLSYKDAYFIIDGEPVRLTNGISEREIAPDSAAKLTSRYFGNEATGDINGDGRDDVVFLLTQDGGGSGTFYYLVAAIKKEVGYLGSNAVFLGDRIAPQTTEIHDGKVIVNYAMRAADEPMAAAPSIGKSLVLKYNAASNIFDEIVQNFEGEADPARMTLNMKQWKWVSATQGGKVLTLKQADRFSITFDNEGRFSATTDCNSMSGQYTAKNGLLSFGAIMSTLMYCDGSQEAEFGAILGDTQKYTFTGKGELVLEQSDGMATFR